MWEAVADARGTVRYRDHMISVDGKVFYDHPRIIHRPSRAVPRNMYLYTTMHFEDGSSMFGYHATDEKGNSIGYYCFGVYIDGSGRSRFLSDARLTRLSIGRDNFPKQWQLRWRNEELAIEADIGVRDQRLLRSWGSPAVASGPKELPLVLDGYAKITTEGSQRTLAGHGLAEYYNAQLY